MIKIILPAVDVKDAIAVRDLIKGVILQDNETAVIVNGGVAITTDNPVRVCLELQAEGFID